MSNPDITSAPAPAAAPASSTPAPAQGALPASRIWLRVALFLAGGA
jgi:hypothetical protein